MTRRTPALVSAAALSAVALALTGCGSATDLAERAANSVYQDAVGQYLPQRATAADEVHASLRFYLSALSQGDPRACSALTSAALQRFRAVDATCEEAISLMPSQPDWAELSQVMALAADSASGAKVAVTGDTATAGLELTNPRDGRSTLTHAIIVREGGAWRIDRVGEEAVVPGGAS